MSNLLDLAAKEIFRREILQLCYQGAPVGCSMDVLRAALSHGTDPGEGELDRQVDYLEAKGLVHTENIGNKRLGLNKTVVRITAEGTDFLEGNTDPVKGVGD